MATTTATQIQQLYVGLLGRAADQGGLNWWADQVTTGGKTLEDVRASFVTSTEYTTTYGAATTRADLVTSIYQNLFERTPSADEVKYWAETDTRPADQLVAAFIEFAGAADQAVINNKTFVAQTYTDTVGTGFNAAGAASVIANVDATPASVATAISNISNGTLTGLVPGVALINAVAAANADKVAYGVAAAVANPTFDTLKADGTTGKDGVVDSGDADAALVKAQGVVTTLNTTSTAANVALNAANTTVAQAKELAVASGKAANVSAFDAALANQKTLIGTATLADAKAAAAAAEDAALAGANIALTANGLLTGAALEAAVTYDSLTAKFNGATSPAGSHAAFDAGSLKTTLEKPATTSAEIAAKAALVTELAKLPTYGQSSIDAVAKVVALDASEVAVGTVAAPGAAATDVVDYAKAAITQAAAAETVSKITVAEAAVAAAKVVVDKYVALDNSIAVAKAALDTFGKVNADKVAIKDVSAGGVVDATAKADVFYFGSKLDATKDFSLGATTHFGAGDSIVLGSNYTFNSGALSTGNGNALEFFLVKGSTGTQVVIETEAYGSSAAGTVVDASGNVTASPTATVINLVGVTADHLSVANGVVSYV